MLQLRINNQPLDLFPGTRLPISDYSPLFDRDAIQRSFSFPVKIPASLRNKRMLAYPTRIDGAGRRKYDNAEIRVAGIQLDQGTAVITGSSAQEIEIVFRNQALELLDNLNNFRIRTDLNITTNVYAGGYLPLIYLSFDLTEYGASPADLVLEVNGNIYQVDKDDAGDLVAQINADFPGVAQVQTVTSSIFEISLSASTKPDLSINTTPALPGGTFYIRADVDLSSTDYEDFYMNVYKAHVDDANGGGVDSHRFPTIYAPNFYDGDNDAWQGYVNYHDESSDVFLPVRSLTEQAQTSLVPMARLQEVMNEIFTLAGNLNITGSFFEDADWQKLIVYNNRSLEKAFSTTDFLSDPESVRNLDDYRYILYEPTIDLSKHLPDLTFYEFITKLLNLIPLVFRVNAGTIEIDTVQELLTPGAIDLTNYSLQDWNKKNTRYSGFELSYERYDTPEEDPHYLKDYSGGNTEDQTLRIKSEFFTHYFRKLVDLNTVDETGGGGRAWTLPIDPFPGKTVADKSKADIDLRLLFYYGHQSDSKGQSYPFASFFPANHSGTSTGAYSLEWDGEKGLYRQHWQEYIDLLMADEVTIQILLPIQKLIEIKQNITTAVYIRHRDGSFRGLIKRLNFSVGIETGNLILCTAQIAKL